MNNLIIKRINNNIAKRLIKKNHYSHTISNAVTLSLGVFIESGDSLFFDCKDERLMGVIVYSVPTGAPVYKSISPLITSQDEIFELTRLWISDELGKNTESYVIGQSFDYIRKNYPRIKVLISYSDTEQGHIGTIYQAVNGWYQGQLAAGGFMYSFDKGKSWRHPKGLYNKTNTTSHTELIKVIPPHITKKVSRKHRYIFCLGNKKFKKQLLKTLNHPILPYPKKELKELI